MYRIYLIVLVLVCLLHSKPIPNISAGFNTAFVSGEPCIGPSFDFGLMIYDKHNFRISSILTLTNYGILGGGIGYQYNVLHKNKSLNLFTGISFGLWYRSKIKPTYFWNPNEPLKEDSPSTTEMYLSEFTTKLEVGKRRVKYFFAEKLFLGKVINNNFETGVSIYIYKS